MNQELSKTYNPNDFEDELYEWWSSHKYFKPETQIKLGIVSKTSQTYCNTIPPPNVTGVLHLGHAITISLQDLMIRYARMNGLRTVFIPGADHAGIATQNVVERELNKKGIKRKEIGRAKFIESVWEWKENSLKVINSQSKKMGMSSDWDREAFTMDKKLSLAVRQAFVKLYEKDLIYKGNYLVNWCPGRCESAISDLESEPIETEGFLWYIRYPVITKSWDGPKFEWGSGQWAKGAEVFIIVATTRPETLLGDSGVATRKDNKEFGNLIGNNAILPVLGRSIPIFEDDSVDPNFGTGAVKVTPAHDFNDYEMGKRHNLEFYSIFDEKAVVVEEFGGPYANLDRFDARKVIIKDLKKEGLLVKTEKHTNNVPHCQRCHTIVEPRDSLQWFVRTKPLVKQVLKKLDQDGINFVPEKMIERLYQWLNPDTIKDWCISRQLWWGHRIPIWYCDDCGEKSTGLDDPTNCRSCNSENIHQDEDVLDTWFSSGLWPFSTLGWPKKTKDFKDFYPTSLRETGYDILFFWIARELMLGVELTGKLPYKTIYLHGLVRNENGQKISKSMENIEEYDPLKIISKYGADTLRYTLIAYSTPGLDMNLDPKNIEASHKFGNKIWQATKYVLGNIPDDFIPLNLEELDYSDFDLSDKWILSQLHNLIKNVTNYMDKYSFLEVARELKRFFWNVFADWYIEISKIRIYDEKNTSFDPRHILVHVLDIYMRLVHPIMPFISEKLWQSLPEKIKDRPSLMISKWPLSNEDFINEEIETSFSNVIDVISNIRGIRGEFTVPHNKLIKAIISANGSSDSLKLAEKEIITLANLESDGLQIGEKIKPPKKVISSVLGEITIYIPLEGLVKVDEELARISKEISKIEKQIISSENKLNGEFSKRAPENLVIEEKEKLKFLIENKDKLLNRKKIISE